MTSAQLRKQLLTIDDIPPGYSADKLTPSDSSNKGSHNFCNYKGTPPKTVALQSFTKNAGLASAVIQLGLRRYASQAMAAEQIQLLKSTMQTCHGETYQGDKLTYTVISSPDLGAAHVGIRLEFKEGTVTQYFFQVGPDLVQVGIGATALGGQEMNELTSLAAEQVKAVERGENG
jgi:hypothetical protein